MGPEKSFHLVGGIAIASLKQMAVPVRCQPDRGVAESLRNALRVHSLVDQQGGIRVPQILDGALAVHSPRRTADPFDCLLQLARVNVFFAPA